MCLALSFFNLFLWDHWIRSCADTSKPQLNLLALPPTTLGLEAGRWLQLPFSWVLGVWTQVFLLVQELLPIELFPWSWNTIFHWKNDKTQPLPWFANLSLELKERAPPYESCCWLNLRFKIKVCVSVNLTSICYLMDHSDKYNFVFVTGSYVTQLALIHSSMTLNFWFSWS